LRHARIRWKRTPGTNRRIREEVARHPRRRADRLTPMSDHREARRRPREPQHLVDHLLELGLGPRTPVRPDDLIVDLMAPRAIENEPPLLFAFRQEAEP